MLTVVTTNLRLSSGTDAVYLHAFSLTSSLIDPSFRFTVCVLLDLSFNNQYAGRISEKGQDKCAPIRAATNSSLVVAVSVAGLTAIVVVTRFFTSGKRSQETEHQKSNAKSF